MPPRSPHRLVAAMLALSAFVAILFAVAGCGREPVATPESRVFFPKQEPVKDEEKFAIKNTARGPMVVVKGEPIPGPALATGELVIDDNGCLRLKEDGESGAGELIVWPAGYRLGTEDDQIRVLDEGRVAARAGERIFTVGRGRITTSGEDYRQLRQQSKVPDACPGPLWVVREGVGPVGEDEGSDQADQLALDAAMYAIDQGISLEEAAHRLELNQNPFPNLESTLRKEEADTFAGLWVKDRPQELRIVVLFTRDGEETIRPYIEGKQGAERVEVRNGAGATMVELEAAQAEAIRIVDNLDVPADSDINVYKNRAELYITDRARFEAALREADAQLPNHVAVIEVDGLARPDDLAE